MPRKTRIPANPAEIALRLAAQPTLWRPLVEFDLDARYYTRLAAQPDFEAWLLTWLPGQATEWHDHGGSAGAFLTLQGTLTEERAELRAGGNPRVIPTARELAAGTLRTFGARHIHRVSNSSAEAAVSLHVYAPELHEMNHFRRDGELLWLVDSKLAGVNW
jgi:predicted metal-dependent enzyme (double-stranded beta helix superfamily)